MTTRFARAVVVLACSVLCATGPAFATPHSAAATRPRYVAIVIDGHGTSCVRYSSGITGDDVLNAAATVHYRQDGLIDQIDKDPATPHADATHYWSYWHDAGGTWTYSTSGAGGYQPAAGTVEGWAFDNGKQTAPAPTETPSGLYAKICGHLDSGRTSSGGTGSGGTSSGAAGTPSSSTAVRPTASRTSTASGPQGRSRNSAATGRSSRPADGSGSSTAASVSRPASPPASAGRTSGGSSAGSTGPGAPASATGPGDATATSTGSVASGSDLAGAAVTPGAVGASPEAATRSSSGSIGSVLLTLGIVVVLAAAAAVAVLRRRRSSGV